MSTHRRDLLRLAAGSVATLGVIGKALAVEPDRRAGTIEDVGHVVILMQENRSFDHYFGALRGVRGFGDPRPVPLPSGQPVWLQPDGKGGHVLPFHLDSKSTSAQVMASLDHSWKGSHERWRRHDAWISAKTPMTMGYFTRADLPFYYALADAFTVCDACHCSIFGPTSPNRMFLFTGTSGVGQAGPLAVMNPPQELNETADPAHDNPKFEGFGWTSYAERLHAAGISWKVYQEYDNYGDNALAYCKAFRGAGRDPELMRRGRGCAPGSNAANSKTSRGEHLVAHFRDDIARGRLPQVSWIVPSYIMSEHPAASPGYGASLTARLLEALADHPAVWAKTVLILNYDENDGFFDHVPPPLPAISPGMGASTIDIAGERYGDEPVGLGPRVPMLAISPWSRGGWVNSELFDHTSVLRFLEARFGVHEPNISPWRRAVCGDLTSAFDFARPDRRRPSLPDASRTMAEVDAAAKGPRPSLPPVQALPDQEDGMRPSRALPYSLQVHGRAEGGRLTLSFVNDGRAGAVFSAWPSQGPDGPWFYTVGAGQRLSASHAFGENGYGLLVDGPNGFLRSFAGRSAGAEVECAYDPSRGRLVLTLRSPAQARRLTVEGGFYAHGPVRTYQLGAGEEVQDAWRLSGTGHWYDLIVRDVSDRAWVRRLAGRMETGRHGVSDPAIGRVRTDT
jgi:phospholipase C